MAKKGLHDIAYETLLGRIVYCQYPPGCWLNEERLVSELGISRTPIRAALQQLQQEQLVQIMPKRGILVTPITAKTVQDLFDLRDLIEPYAIEHYGASFEKEELLRFLDIFSAPTEGCDIEASFHADADFHIRIVSLTHNEILCDFYRQMQNQLIRISCVGSTASKRRLADSNREHTDILLALLKDNTEEAVEKLRLHLRLGRVSGYQTVLNTRSLNNLPAEA